MHNESSFYSIVHSVLSMCPLLGKENSSSLFHTDEVITVRVTCILFKIFSHRDSTL